MSTSPQENHPIIIIIMVFLTSESKILWINGDTCIGIVIKSGDKIPQVFIYVATITHSSKIETGLWNNSMWSFEGTGICGMEFSECRTQLEQWFVDY